MVKQDNIILNLEHNTIEVNPMEYDLDKDSILIQVKHTLIDTRAGMDCFSSLNKINENAFYYGYVSIGEIIDVGADVQYCRKGMCVVLPATYQKFIVISEQQKQSLSNIMFRILPESLNVDVIQTLFYPLLGVANILIEWLQEEEITEITLVGCHALGGVLMKLCQLNEISCKVILGAEDVSKAFVEENGGSVTTFSEESLEDSNTLILLETLDSLEDQEYLQSNEYIDVNMLLEDEYGSGIWKNRYIQSTILEVLENHDIDVSDMIGQHVHAEAAEGTLRDIREGKYQGKVLVYDW